MTALTTGSRARTREESAGDSAPPPGPQLPPKWVSAAVMNVGKTIAVAICSAIIGAATSAWQVRGMLDDRDTHLRVHDIQIEGLKQDVDRGFNNVRQDLRDLRTDLKRSP